MNMLCLLPNYCIAVSVWTPHGCGGYYMADEWCYGPQGRIGMRADRTGASPRGHVGARSA